MILTAAEESLLKLALTIDINCLEKMLAGELARRYPDGEFYEYDPSTDRQWKYNSRMSTRCGFKYKFERDGQSYKAEVVIAAISQSTKNINTHMGISFCGFNKSNKPSITNISQGHTRFWCADAFWCAEGCSDDVYAIKLGDTIRTVFTKFEKAENEIPAYLEKLDQQRAEAEEQRANLRVQRSSARDRKKQLVFQNHNVTSTPETELLFKVLSRLNNEKAISKAFGELLPLIGGKNGQQS
jgi:hypothetical protein